LTIIGFIALHAELLRAIPETLLRSGTFRNRCATTARRTRFSVIQIALAHTRIVIIIIIIIIIPLLMATAFPPTVRLAGCRYMRIKTDDGAKLDRYELINRFVKTIKFSSRMTLAGMPLVGNRIAQFELRTAERIHNVLCNIMKNIDVS